MKSRMMAGAAAMLGLAMLGCDTVNTTERANPVAMRQMVADKRVITDSDFNRRVAITGVNEATTPGGFLRVQVEMLNRSRSQQSFLYQFEWFDEAGMQISSPGGSLIPRTIEGGESMMLVATAPTPRAKDFRLKVIEQ